MLRIKPFTHHWWEGEGGLAILYRKLFTKGECKIQKNASGGDSMSMKKWSREIFSSRKA